MQQIQPDQANFLLNAIYLPSLKREHETTKNVIAAIPADKGGYRPDPVSKSAMELAWHIATAELMFIDAVINGEFQFGPKPMPESIKNSADLVAWYGEQYQQRLEKLSKLPADQLTRTVDFRGMLQQPAVFYLNLNLHHAVHHRGQLSVYLRPMGGKVPAIYGESHDSAQAKQAAQKAG